MHTINEADVSHARETAYDDCVAIQRLGADGRDVVKGMLAGVRAFIEEQVGAEDFDKEWKKLVVELESTGD